MNGKSKMARSTSTCSKQMIITNKYLQQGRQRKRTEQIVDSPSISYTHQSVL